MINYVQAKKAAKETAQRPIQIEVVNAADFKEPKSTVVEIRRDNSGQMTGAVAQKI